MVVCSLPAYVVGTARIGSPVVSAIALASPVDEPPPTRHDDVGTGVGDRGAGPVGELDRDVLHDLVPAGGDERIERGRRARRRSPWPDRRR